MTETTPENELKEYQKSLLGILYDIDSGLSLNEQYIRQMPTSELALMDDKFVRELDAILQSVSWRVSYFGACVDQIKKAKARQADCK
jgi:hypothetical protein